MNTTDVTDAAKDAVARSRTLLGDQLGARGKQLGTQLTTVAEDLRRVGDELRTNGTSAGAADLADRGAEWIEGAGRYFESADGERLIADAENFARERPWAVASAALAAGFAASRVLKASASRRFRSTYDTGYGNYVAGNAAYAGTGGATFGTDPSYRELTPYES